MPGLTPRGWVHTTPEGGSCTWQPVQGCVVGMAPGAAWVTGQPVQLSCEVCLGALKID